MNNKNLLPRFSFALVFVWATAFAHSPVAMAEPVSKLKERVSGRMNSLISSSEFKDGQLGLWAGARGDSGLETLFAQNAEKQFIPASLSKLVTGGAVLSALHPGYKFKTTLLADMKPENGVLKGPLYIKGGGDPTFVSENMWFLVNELVRSGVTSIEGDVIVDDSRFDAVRFGQDRQDERVDRAYDAPVGALSMNWNSVSVYVRPGDKVGEPLQVFADVQSPYLKVRNETRTAAAGRGKNIVVERRSEKGFEGDVIVVKGAMAAGLPETVVYKSITRPDLWTGHNLVEFLKQRGIAVKGKVKSGVTPKNSNVLASSESRPLTAVVSEMNKWSNNYVAEMLVKALAAENGEEPATMSGGMSHVLTYLGKAGLKKGEYEFINAAGFTRRNSLSPAQIGKILDHVRSDFVIFPEFLASLPVAGVDGTLRSRMKATSAEKWVRAKTGLLNGVVGLSGYAGRRDGQIIAFAFIYNGPGKEDRARALFDRLAAALVED